METIEQYTLQDIASDHRNKDAQADFKDVNLYPNNDELTSNHIRSAQNCNF